MSVALFLAATALGIRRLAERRRPRPLVALARRPGAAAAILLGSLILAGAVQGPLPVWGWVPGGHGGSPHHGFSPDPEAEALARAVDLVPDGVAVSASNAPGAHLSARARVHLFPKIADADWIVISSPARSDGDLALRRGTLRPGPAARQARRVARSGIWERVYREGDVEVYRRAVPQTASVEPGSP